MSESAYQIKVQQQLQNYVQNVKRKQEYSKLNKSNQALKSLWKHHGPTFQKSMTKGFTGFGVKSMLKDRPHNTFEFIQPNTERDKKMFKTVQGPEKIEVSSGQEPCFNFFEAKSVGGDMVLKNSDQYV